MNKIFLLTFPIVVSSLFNSCNKNKQEEQVVENNHQSEIKDTDSYFFQNGTTDYKILMPDTQSEYYKFAKDELINLVSEATGYTLSVETEAVNSHNNNQKYISIGETDLYKSTELVNEKSDLKRNGSKIITKDNNIYIFGADDAAVLYGTYNLLNIYFNFETYTNNIYKLDKGVKNLKFKEIKLIDNPDIEFRQKRGLLFASTTNYNDKMFSYRLRALDGYGNMFLPIHSGDTKDSDFRQEHNSFYYFPEVLYKNTHPDFYGGTGQLCFTAHGKTEEFNAMVDIAAEKIEQCLQFYKPSEYPDYNSVELGINDNGNNSMCSCSSCTAYKKAHNNSDCAALIYFYKKVGKKVDMWMSLEENAEYRRDLSYVFLVYQDTLVPPFTDPTNIPEEIRINPNDPKLQPFVAISGSDLTKKVSDSENLKCRTYIEKWGAAYPGALAWSYGGFFNDYLTFFDVYNFYSDYHNYLKANNFRFSFEQVIDMQRGGTTGFFSLSDYVLLKKAWNSSLQVDDLIDDYLHNVYSDAYSYMKEMFTQWRLWFSRNQLENHWGEGVNQKTASADWYNVGFLKQMLGLYSNALDSISKYKDDPVYYQKFKDAIDSEYIAIAKPAIGYFSSDFTSEELANMKANLKNIISRLGITRISESTYITNYVNSLN